MNYAPEKIGTGKYSAELAEWLANKGIEVCVIAAPPYYPEWRVQSTYSAWRYKREVIKQVIVWRSPLWVPKIPRGLTRILHLFTFAISSAPIAIRYAFWKPDYIFVVEPPIVTAPIALFVARICNSNSWLHIQDFEIDAAFKLGWIHGKKIRSLAEKIEHWLMRRFNHVSTISNNMIKGLERKGISNGVLLPNWVDTTLIYPDNTQNTYRQQLGIDEETVVAMYSGTMARKQGLEILVQAAKVFSNSNIKGASDKSTGDVLFVFCGTGPGRNELNDSCKYLENVRLLDLQPTERLNELLNMADIHLLPQKADAADLVLPSKLTGMMASGRAILAIADEHTEIANILEDKGVVVSPGDQAEFVRALKTLAEDTGLRERLGKAAREYAVQHLEKEVILRRFENHLRNLAPN